LPIGKDGLGATRPSPALVRAVKFYASAMDIDLFDHGSLLPFDSESGSTAILILWLIVMSAISPAIVQRLRGGSSVQYWTILINSSPVAGGT